MELKLLIDSIIQEASQRLGKNLEVTSALRTPYSQAKAMYPHFESNSPTLRSYAPYKKEMLQEIQSAYQKGKNEKKDKRAVIDSMTAVIQNQIKTNKFISNHLSNTARDIRTKSLST